jgi:hypothetical protein
MTAERTCSVDPGLVAQRLAELRQLYVAETIDEARLRLARERPRDRADFALSVARALEELRALCELARYLHDARDPEGPVEEPIA